MLVTPTILTSNLQQAQTHLHQISQVKRLCWVQADIIDGIFADNKTLQPMDWSQLITQYPNLKFEAHLMIKNPTEWIHPCLDAGFSRLTAQIEMMDSQREFVKPPGLDTLKTTKNMDPSPGVKRNQSPSPGVNNTKQSKFLIPYSKFEIGLALDLPTPVSQLDQSILKDLDVILLMSVPAGFGGQQFNPSVLDKISQLDQLRRKHQYRYQIEVDGGINPSNIGDIKKAGADIACIGHSLLKDDIVKNLQALQLV